MTEKRLRDDDPVSVGVEMQTPAEIAEDFTRSYEQAWASGSVEELLRLYDDDAILVGYKFARGREEIGAMLGSIIGRGFSRVSIRVVDARRVGDAVLVASEYSASGTGISETPPAKSSQVLIIRESGWVTVMHTAS